ncbi:protein TolR [Endozoicomonas sp. GU-1]|uniref:protein TolR n=1 Tax=Endozoicomonas TaxID=305899 RepID=UPI0022B35590|nr:protein TolR [Endozoicomonas sp. GU-1]WBA80152.1 protein TolR [Endozoicomonas sp. GU-1]WBA87727.1 protein TolR [Endozoicomonas sp. GU-1]
MSPMISGAKIRSRRKPMSEINMVPFIDIMMVLLVAFMITAPMMTQGVKVELPKTSSDNIALPEDKEVLVISIKADGSYYMDVGSDHDKAVNLSSLTEKVSKVVSARPGTQVLIQGDTSVAYGSVVQLMAGLQNSGISHVGLVTDPVAVGMEER